MKTPRILNKIVDVVLKYRPEAKQKPPRQRKISKKAYLMRRIEVADDNVRKSIKSKEISDAIEARKLRLTNQRIDKRTPKC
jgi:hypothetical protein